MTTNMGKEAIVDGGMALGGEKTATIVEHGPMFADSKACGRLQCLSL